MSELTRNEKTIIDAISNTISNTLLELSEMTRDNDISDNEIEFDELFKYCEHLMQNRRDLFDMFMNM